MGDSGRQNRSGQSVLPGAGDVRRSACVVLTPREAIGSKNAVSGSAAKVRWAQVNSDISANTATITLKTVTVEQNNGVNFTTVVVSIVTLASLLLGVIVAILAIGVTQKIGLVLH